MHAKQTSAPPLTPLPVPLSTSHPLPNAFQSLTPPPPLLHAMSLPAAYSKAVASIHWLSGPAMIASIGCVLTVQNAPKGEKGD